MRYKALGVTLGLIAVAIGSRGVSIGAQIEPVLKIENVSVDKDLGVKDHAGETARVDDAGKPAEGATEIKAEAVVEVSTTAVVPETQVAVEGAAVVPEPQKVTDADAVIASEDVDQPKFTESVDERERRVSESEANLVAYEARVKMQLDELKALKGEIVAIRDSMVTKQSEDTKRMASMYGNMKAKDAAEIMNAMPVPLVVALIDSMTDMQATSVLGALDAKLAKNVTSSILARGKGMKSE